MTKQELPLTLPLPAKDENPVFVVDQVAEKIGEEHWEDAVNDLPGELREHWSLKLRPQVETGKLSNVDACRMVHEAVAQREKIVGTYLAHGEHGVSRKRENSNIFHRLMETQVADKEIGSGDVARVYYVDGAPEFCLKVVWNQAAYEKGNTVSQESRFLEDLSDFTAAGVRTPRFVDFFSGLQMNAILMERVNGAGLDKIMAGEEDFPAEFSLEDFFRRLEEYFEALHKRNIFHMDIFPRNIMVDRETGLPIVIDFGKSEHFDFSEEVGLNCAQTDRVGLRNAKKEVHDFLETGLRPQLLALDKPKKF